VQFEDPTLDIDEILHRNDVVNLTAFANRSARTLKLNVTSAELGSFGNFAAWRIGYRCTYDRDTWDEERLDIGPVYWNTDSPRKKLVFFDETNSFRVVGKLNGAGGKQTDQDDDPQVLYRRVFEEVEFRDFIRT
jgi:hypothetical protein